MEQIEVARRVDSLMNGSRGSRLQRQVRTFRQLSDSGSRLTLQSSSPVRCATSAFTQLTSADAQQPLVTGAMEL